MAKLTTVVLQFIDDGPDQPLEHAVNAWMRAQGHLPFFDRPGMRKLFSGTYRNFAYREFAVHLRGLPWPDPAYAVLTVTDEDVEGAVTTRMDEPQTDDPTSPWYVTDVAALD